MEKLQNVLTCSICLEFFQKPVTLSCQHTFCRACLQEFADSSRQTTGDESRTDSVTETDQHISCPACRAVISLGCTGVAGLPPSYKLAEIVEILQENGETRSKSLPCDMCEGESKAAATKACATCRIVYCDGCLSEIHPERGPLRRHNVMPLGEFLIHRPPPDVLQGLNPGVKCKDHASMVTIFCVSCDKLICHHCVSQHNKHMFSDIPEASESMKVSFMQKTDQCKELKKTMEDCIAKFDVVMANIQEKEGLHNEAVEAAYNDALKTLKAKRVDSLKAVKTRHGEWYAECQTARDDLQEKVDKIGDILMKSSEITYAANVVFIKNQQQWTTMYYDRFLPHEDMTDQLDIPQIYQMELDRDAVVKRRFALSETVDDQAQNEAVSKPCYHRGYFCDVCLKRIVGIRYKCGNCPNYDLCESCEKLSRIHDPDHVFLKLRRHVPHAGIVNGVRVPLFKYIL